MGTYYSTHSKSLVEALENARLLLRTIFITLRLVMEEALGKGPLVA